MRNQDDALKRLRGWMMVEGISTADMAAAMEINRQHVMKVTTGNTPLSPSFAWKFAEAYSFELARKLFSETERIPA